MDLRLGSTIVDIDTIVIATTNKWLQELESRLALFCEKEEGEEKVRWSLRALREEIIWENKARRKIYKEIAVNRSVRRSTFGVPPLPFSGSMHVGIG